MHSDQREPQAVSGQEEWPERGAVMLKAHEKEAIRRVKLARRTTESEILRSMTIAEILAEAATLPPEDEPATADRGAA